MNDLKVGIVTGASSGIGAETAYALASRGYAVVLAARRQDKLQHVAQRCRQCGGQAKSVVTDVADAAQVETLVQKVIEDFGRIDVLVNNAGFGVHARVHETTPDQMQRIFDVNFFGVFHGCRAVAPVMIHQRSGHIFNVSSIIGKRGTPFNGAYCATKFAVCGLSDSLRVELKPSNVRVTCVLPGLTDTEFFEHVEGGTPRKKTSFQWLRSMQPASVVARRIAVTIGKDKPELLLSFPSRLLVFLASTCPRLTDAMMRVYHDDLRGPVRTF